MSDQLYRELIFENYRHPKNNYKPAEFSHSHELKNLTCGDEIKVYANLGEDNKIKSLNYEVRGCAIATATASLLSQILPDMELSEIAKLDIEYLEELLGNKLSINRVKCALLPLRAMQQALGLKDQVGGF